MLPITRREFLKTLTAAFGVTVAQYAERVNAGGCAALEKRSSFTHESYFDNPAFAGYPVVYVSWYDCAAPSAQ